MTADTEETPPVTTQTFWLSFADGQRPEGQQNLGVAIVDVRPEDADEGEARARALRRANGIVTGVMLDADRYTAGAVYVSHLMGCNPGGDVQIMRIDHAPGFADRDALGKLPRNRLMSEAELRRVGAID